MMKKNKSWLNITNIFVLVFFIMVGLIISYQLIFIPSLRKPTGLPSPMIDFDSKYHSFSIKHPKSWIAVESESGLHYDPELIADITRAGKSIPGVLIAYKHLTSANIEDATNWGRDRITNCNSFQAGITETVTISGINGLKFGYTCVRSVDFLTKRNNLVRCTDYYLVSIQSAYDLTFCSEDKYWTEVEGVFDQMINSFSLR